MTPQIEQARKIIESLEIDCTNPVCSPREYVSHEMAIDAQDKELEGQIYKEETWERCGACPNCMFNQIRPTLLRVLGRCDEEWFKNELSHGYNLWVNTNNAEDSLTKIQAQAIISALIEERK